jgi:hypothetical protein
MDPKATAKQFLDAYGGFAASECLRTVASAASQQALSL